MIGCQLLIDAMLQFVMLAVYMGLYSGQWKNMYVQQLTL